MKKIDVSKVTKYSQGELVNYVYKSLKNHTYNLIKHKARKNIVESCMEFEMPYYDYYQEIELDTFYSYITKLTNMQKKIIIGLFVYGYTISELSKILNISRQAINQNKLRALRIIKQKVDKL
nr:sigma-70 family RNA polymerase sigma factor [Sedimentibacter sp. zth1]